MIAEPFKDREFELGENEVVVFVGQENMVRLQKSGELEARLAMAFADKKPRFRYMAWEGDTVYEQRRELNFGSWEDQLNAIDATVVVAQYGLMESLDGKERLGEFVAAYHRLLDRFATKTKKLVLIPPIRTESSQLRPAWNHAARPAPQEYVAAIRDIATQRNAIYVDLYSDLTLRQQKSYQRYTNADGIHLNPHGTQNHSVLHQPGSLRRLSSASGLRSGC